MATRHSWPVMRIQAQAVLALNVAASYLNPMVGFCGMNTTAGEV